MLQLTAGWDRAGAAYEAAVNAPEVTVLMAVHRGYAHLGEQLDSFAAQDHGTWRLIASIDGPDDGCRALLKAHPQAFRITCVGGPGRGAAANFLHLIRNVRPGGFWAFSDQDDVWLPHKLSRALERLAGADPARPALYHSRSWVTDALLGHRRLSPARDKPAGFANALVQNVAAGNTIVLNEAAARLAHEAAAEAGEVAAHDWWLYQIVTGVGGTVIHDDAPGLLYRQHEGNLLGAHLGWRARARRLRMVLDGTYRRWIDTNIGALRASAHRFTPQNRARLAALARARRAGLRHRVALLHRIGLYRQSRLSGAAMWLLMLIGKF